MRDGSFTPGALSTPEDTSTAGAPLTATASATFSGVRPPDSSQRPDRLRPATSRQSKAAPLPPGSASGAPAGGRASNSSRSAAPAYSSARARSVRPGDGDGLDRREAETGADLADAARGFAPVQLQGGERDARGDLGEQRVVRVDEDADALDAGRDRGRQRGRVGDGDAAGRGRVEHQADERRAAIDRRGEGGAAGYPADLDRGAGHAGPAISAAMRRAAAAGSAARTMGRPITR